MSTPRVEQELRDILTIASDESQSHAHRIGRIEVIASFALGKLTGEDPFALVKTR